MFGANAFGWAYPAQAYAGTTTTAYGKSVSGALSFSGSAPVFAMNRSVAAGFTPTGALKRNANRVITAALSPAAGFSKRALRSLTAGLVPIGALAKREARVFAAGLAPAGAFTGVKVLARTLTGSVLQFIGGANLYPDPALYPDPNLWPYGGAILFQLNRTLAAALHPVAALGTHASQARIFTATLQPQVLFLKTTTRLFLSAAFSSAAFVAVRSSHTVAQALFASLRNAGSLSTITNAGHVDEGGGGFGVPMPDAFFQRYQPTLRRQKMRV